MSWRLSLLAFAIACLVLPTEGLARPKEEKKKCTVEQVGRIDPGKEAQCILNGGVPKCTSTRWYCCYKKESGGETCTPRDYTSQIDPGEPGTRPPSAESGDKAPDRVSPPSEKPSQPAPSEIQ